MGIRNATAPVSAGILLLAAIAVPTEAAPAAPDTMQFGVAMGTHKELASAELPLTYGSFWVGAWTSKQGWGYAESQLNYAVANDITPVINWWYWGDDISRSCVEHGCWSNLHGVQKDKATWYRMTYELADLLARKMGGRESIVVIETEFNKNDIPTWETFDSYLADHASVFRSRGVKTVIGFGFWGSGEWKTFDRAVGEADYAGTMMLRSSVRHPTTYDRSVTDLVDGASKLQTLFGKPVLVTDFALSSYPEPEWADRQARQYEALAARLGDLKAAGVHGLVLRHLIDNPAFDTRNYHGEAERWWGLLHADGSKKPAYDVVLRMMQAETTPPTEPAPEPAPTPEPEPAPEPEPEPTPPPPEDVDPPLPSLDGAHEAESFTTKSTGGLYKSGSASGGVGWNLWANGYIEQTFAVAAGGKREITIVASGDLAGTAPPRMTLRANGVLVGAWDVPSRTLLSYRATAEFPPGETTLRVEFTNDYYDKATGADRNLHVDVVKAGAPPVLRWQGEAEAFRASTGGKFSDKAASGGAAWNLWSNGHLTSKIGAGSAGPHTIAVVAKGDYGKGWPTMRVLVDGKLAGEFSVTSTSWRTYAVTRDLGAGEHDVRVEYVNDYYQRGVADRNLRVDVVTVRTA